jgi:hypothetical protein
MSCSSSTARLASNLAQQQRSNFAAAAAAAAAAGTKRKETVRGQAAVLLSDHDRDRFEDMLRGLTAERAAIAEVRCCCGCCCCGFGCVHGCTA